MDFLGFVASVGRFIRKARNNLIYNKKLKSTSSIISKANLIQSEHSEAMASPIWVGSGDEVFSSGVLHSGGLKILCDGAFNFDSNSTTIGCDLIDGSFGLCVIVSKSVRTLSALMSEALAMRETCLGLQACNLQAVSAFNDSKILISLISSELDPPWEVAVIVKNIRFLSAPLGIRWQFLPRSFNLVAHWVAKESIRGSLFVNWVYTPLRN